MVRLTLNRSTLFAMVLGGFCLGGVMAADRPDVSPQAQGGRTGQDALASFDAWSQRQALYSADEIASARKRILEKLHSQSAADAATFHQQLNEKLGVLNSQAALAAERWLAETLAVATDAYANKIRATLPDLVNDSPSQLKATILALEAREANMRQVRQGFSESRKMTVRAIEQDTRRREEANSEARISRAGSPAAPLGNAGGTGGGPRLYPRIVTPYAPSPAYPYP
jgi:hypothetical protein